MTPWEQLTARTSEIDALASAMALLEWDQQTNLPVAGGPARGEQLAVLGRIHHERSTGPEVGEWLAALQDGQLTDEQRAAVRGMRRRYRRATVIPARLVEESARARTAGFAAWIQAKEASDFRLFEEPLQRLIEVVREQAAHLATVADGPVGHPYDALLEDYDPGTTVAELRPMFSRLSRELNVLLDAVAGRPHPAPVGRTFDHDGLRRLSDRILRDLGFDTRAGRLDLAEHPFSTGIGAGDTRITMHLVGDNLLATLGGVIHETGHGMYEQGLRADWAGTGLNRAVSFGMHESQSRFWENYIGRSQAFFRYLVPRMAGIWPDLALSPMDLYGAANRVERSLIRIYADEATYNLHIIARFEVELGILEGRLNAKDLPEAWDDAYRRNVGVVADNARQGVLQDVHWSSGLFAYFPSYTMGNLYAASLGATIEAQLPDLWAQVEQGDFHAILGWLRTHIHRPGSLMDAPDLFHAAVGRRDPVEDLVAHLWRRQGALYGVTRPNP